LFLLSREGCISTTKFVFVRLNNVRYWISDNNRFSSFKISLSNVKWCCGRAIKKLPFDACVRLAQLYFCGRGLDCSTSLYSPSIFYSSVTATKERKKEPVVAQIENTDTKNLSGIIALSVCSISVSLSNRIKSDDCSILKNNVVVLENE